MSFPEDRARFVGAFPSIPLTSKEVLIAHQRATVNLISAHLGYTHRVSPITYPPSYIYSPHPLYYQKKIGKSNEKLHFLSIFFGQGISRFGRKIYKKMRKKWKFPWEEK